MAVQNPTTSKPRSPDLLRQAWPIVLGVGIVAVAFIILLSINRDMLLFPLLSAIGFPLLAVSPFIIYQLKMPTNVKVLLAIIVVLVIIPFLGLEDSFYLELGIQIGVFAALALGLNIVVGFAGLLDLGYVAFFAVGAYLWGVFASREADTIIKTSGALAPPETFYLFIFGGIILAAIAGILLGLPVLRLRGDYLAIVTLGFGEMIRVLVSNLSNISSNPKIKINITNGAQGLPGIESPPLPAWAFDLVRSLTSALHINVINLEALTYQMFYYLLVLLVGLIVIVIASRLENSPIGRAWTAIREDETAAIAMGVPLVRMKLLAFATGASFAGAIGVIFAAKQTFIDPSSVRFEQSIFILTIVIVGGMGSIRGVLLGAVAVTLLNLQILKNISQVMNSLRNIDYVVPLINFPIKSWPVQLEPAKYERFVFGILLVLMMIFRPTGILPATRRKLEMQERMGKDPVEPQPDLVETPPDPALSETGTGEPTHAA